MSNGTFEPRIVAFLCNWCSYAGADLTGTSRIQYSPNIKALRLNCSSRIDPTFVIKAIMSGADGVLVAGCHPGDCHYKSGNLYTRRRVMMLKTVLETIGIPPNRLRLEWVSASEAIKFATVVNDFVEEIKELGPNSIGGR
ncbi:MAG: hydrogenase iron-sulfur subunit [Candidatus Thorarchaeota archaeon SMTZ1-45]|nr:MAG: methyl-viologen-reducing hydrogenase subunit delta [Candidatus Thorarchaeota archaeon SMTZ1-45]